MNKWNAFFFGVASYLVFAACAIWAAGFIGGFGVPVTLDTTASDPLWQALLVNLGLLGLFAVQHSVMARAGFKRWWTRVVSPVIERSSFVLAASLLLMLLLWQWRPLGGVLWQVQGTTAVVAVYTLYAAGWVVLLGATFLIDHFEMFGLRRVWNQLRGQTAKPRRFVTPGLYRFLRHPFYLGWLLIFWVAPTMTVSHLLFALVASAYILVGMRLEERDLVRRFGERYRRYQREVPGLLPVLLPRRWRRKAAAADAAN